MAITDYASLKTTIADWMFRRTDLTSDIDTFIDNAEARFNYGTGQDAPFASEPIRTRDMITSSNLTLTTGSVALPAGYLEPIRITALTSPRMLLDYGPPGWLDEIYPDTTASDPAFYTILGANLVVRPTTTSQVELQYYTKIAALSGSATTNWLLLATPNAYLYASVLEACLFIGNMERATVMYGLMMGVIGGLQRTDRRSAATMPAKRTSGAVA